MKHVLIVRVDRLGDVLVSLPALQRARTVFGEAFVTLAVQPYASELIPGQRLLYEPKGRHAGVRGFWTLVKDLKGKRFDAVVFLQPERRMSFAAWCARVPVRVGPLNRWFTYFVYNHGLRQKRSRVEKHEAGYNLDLLEVLFKVLGNDFVESGDEVLSPTLEDSARERVQDFMRREGLSTGGFSVVHPGMGGSALNLSSKQYEYLIQRWLENGPVVLTGTEAERKLVQGYRERLGDPKIKLFVGESLSALGFLFKNSRGVFAPSTGPLHLASQLGVSTRSVYPPIQVQSVKRWGPLGKKSKILVPEVQCPAIFKCLGESCAFFPCMERVNLEKLDLE